eukprot:m.25140 g.25140  ORF g.25140 m.25140 type:complete len:52 (+) comp11414_c0_seq1:938-1093(+)
MLSLSVQSSVQRTQMGTIFSRIILESKPPAALLLEDFVLEHGNVTEAATEV